MHSNTQHTSPMLTSLLRRLCSRLCRPLCGSPRPKVFVTKLGKSDDPKSPNGSVSIQPNNGQQGPGGFEPPEGTIRVATFNASLFSMAPAVPSKKIKAELRTKSGNDRPKGILKPSPSINADSTGNSGGGSNLSKQKKFARSKFRVSINLPDNEISRQLSFAEKEKQDGDEGSAGKERCGAGGRRRTVVEVLRELDADILGLQDVKAEEEKGMKPLSDLAEALGMNYVFAESWAPEYGNAVLSKWPIKRWKSQKIFDQTDFRNVLKATIDVPQAGELSFYCTHLDHLDENWRMKQIDAILQSNDEPHILAGGLNSLNESDYSPERWTDIVKYYEDMGKPTPKVEVMKFLKRRQYTDAKDFAGECEPVVVIAKGQSVQGTCKYGTRLDYILASPNSPYKFVPGSYAVFSSKGTSDHHIVKVDITKAKESAQESASGKRQHLKQKVVKIGIPPSPNGVFRTNTRERY